MHGLLLSQLRRFAAEKHGVQAELRDRVFVTTETYPDAEFVAAVNAVAKRAGTDVQALLEEFGEFIAPTLLSAYKPFIRPEWKALDVLEHTENNIHRAVRLHDPEAIPPRLQFRRVSPREVVIFYESARKLCAVARGIARGVAVHYGEQVEITDLTCMLKGKPTCTIAVTLASG